MASEKLQYDAKVGGAVTLDTQVQTYRYAAGAMQEMRRLLNDVDNSQAHQSKLVFQTLPRHMRRRAMSHHPKRLPRKYRAQHIAQMLKGGDMAATKRPSRKYRRRPRNLLKEYIRRQRCHIWLETHIWHAKRFRMINRWGYRLPYQSCDKSYRACYRATTKHCLLQDISYYACIELKGDWNIIAHGFQQLTSEECGLSIAARTYMSGRREGCIELFRAEQYPYGALGRVTFIWRPVADEQQAARTLWLWLHPSIYTAVLIEVLKVFELVSTKSVTVPITDDECAALEEAAQRQAPNAEKSDGEAAPETKVERRLQFMTKTQAYQRIKRYRNEAKGLELSELRDTMNRFRLTGPLAQAVLTKAFRCKDLAATCDERTPSNWFTELISSDNAFKQHHLKQAEYWRKSEVLVTPAVLMSNMVLSLNIDDPRIHRPKRRTKAESGVDELNMADLLNKADAELVQSALWDANIRDRLCRDMLTTQAYCQRRAKHAAIPGASCQFEAELQPVPVLLIQRPGSQQGGYKRLAYAAGWDVIAPIGYGMPIWLSLIMWGAKPGGLKESETLARELGMDEQLPDTAAGKQFAAEQHAELSAEYFRMPSNRRINYRKLAIVSPFRVPFPQLVRDWQDELTDTAQDQRYYVLRNYEQLRALNAYIKHRAPFPGSLASATNCLVQLQVRLMWRGNPNTFGLLCVPTAGDVKRNLRFFMQNNHDPVHSEPPLKDPDEKKRKMLRVQHKKLLKRLRARRVREKRKLQESSNKRVHIRAANTAQLNAAHAATMRALWLPEQLETLYSVRKQCTREVCGYLTDAGFSFIEAKWCGVGYMTLPGLRAAVELSGHLRLKQSVCLMRGTNTYHYRFGCFQVNERV